jgi:NAD(P)-dependent dehydrogenase (short-subunit alcohol dehydrogenase family)
MSNTKDKNQQVDNSKRKTSITRRGIIGAGVAGLAAVTAKSAIANTQKPVQPESGKADSNGKFKDKVVLITGATSGIGKATAYAFAKEGAKVFFCGRRTNLGEANAREIQAFGGEATYMPADVRREKDILAFVDGCVKKYGRIDIAFNNAGIESSPNTIADTSLEDWMNVMNTNATGVFLSMKYELPVMLKQKGGIIVNNASVSSHVGFATISPYSASKHAIASLTKVAALEYTDKNIRVNSVSPGAVDTPMLRRALAAWKTNFESVSQDYPLKRIVNPEEIARTVMWLSSDDASCIVGMDVDATGGYLTK